VRDVAIALLRTNEDADDRAMLEEVVTRLLKDLRAARIEIQGGFVLLARQHIDGQVLPPRLRERVVVVETDRVRQLEPTRSSSSVLRRF
jgi:hypothetical protein